jgi:hypothetical protein
MPTFAELLDQVSFLASTPASVAALLAAGCIVVFFDWRVLVFAFGTMAVFTGLLYSQLLPAQVAGIKMLVGLLIAMQMFVTGRYIEHNRAGPVLKNANTSDQAPAVDHWRSTTGLPFRVVVVVMVLLISWQASLATNLTLPDVQPVISATVIGLVAMGLLGLGLTEEPLKAGILLLTMLAGFELYYAAIEPALAVIALLAATNFAVALAASYLAVIKSLPARDAGTRRDIHR